MFQTDSFEQASEYAEKALSLMAEKHIPATPENFTIWYAHFSGRNPDLTRMLGILLDNNQEFTQAICADIYKKFFTSEFTDDTLQETASRIEVELERIMEYLGVAGDGAAEYGRTLEKTEGNILHAKNTDGLKDAITHVLTETRKMEQLNLTLENQLKDSSSEIVQLREDLEDMRREALTDALTGIANRKLFDMELRHQVREVMETGDKLCMVMLDIDHFKQFNDTHGHQVGDEVIKLLANTLKKSVKGNDLAARYGGEEFAVILPHTPLEGAIRVADAIRSRISSKKLVNRQTNQDLGKITISAGVAEFDMGEPIADFIRRADQALYVAKARGRDCVVDEEDMKKDELTFDE